MAVRKRQLNRSSRNVPFGSDAGEKRQYSWFGPKMNILSWSVLIVCLLWGCGTIGFRLGEIIALKYFDDEPIEVESPASEDEEYVKAYGQLLKYPPPPPRRDITKRNTVQRWWGSAGPEKGNLINKKVTVEQ